MKAKSAIQKEPDVFSIILDNDKLFESRQDALKNLQSYISREYLSKHPKTYTIERLKQIKRNILRWIVLVEKDFPINDYMEVTVKGEPTRKFKEREKANSEKTLEIFRSTINAIDADIERLKKQPLNVPEINPLDLISQDKISLLQMWEDALRGEIEKWLKGEDVELCAAFINYLFEKSFFNPDKISIGIKFALSRYQIEVKSSLYKLRKTKNKDLLSQRTDEVVRLISGKKYGQM